jgi:histidyl-tRNA synthetase
VSVSGDTSVNISGDVMGSSILGDLNGQVTNSIQQLATSTAVGRQGLADILKQLQDAAVSDQALSEEQKQAALEAIETLAEEGKKKPEQRLGKLCSMAVNALKGVTATVSDVSKLADILQKSLPTIMALLGL